jgi:predicted Rossmann fold flavoprotein
MNRQKHDVIIIGGGAAGMLAAGFCARSGKSTLLIEKNEKLGKKIYITGKGRCNVTNNCPPSEMIKKIPKNPTFMYSALNQFEAADTMALIESLGVPLKTERGNRVFPVSDKSSDIIKALKRFCETYCVEVVQETVKKLQPKTDAENRIWEVTCTNRTFSCEKVLLATGGLSYPSTGSTGDGYAIAKNLGHTITPLRPALVPMETEEDCSLLTGLTLKNTKLTFLDDKNAVLYAEQGELLFTHFGISGPLVLTASAFWNRDAKKHTVKLDMKPALDEKQLDERLLRELSAAPNKNIENILGTLLPKSMIPSVLSKAEIPPEIKGNSLSAVMRNRLVRTLKGYTLTVTRLRSYNEAVITDGGICVKEVNPKTMESKCAEGLFFAGEILDVFGQTGGFNLQIAFSTAYAAAKGICGEDFIPFYGEA